MSYSHELFGKEILVLVFTVSPMEMMRALKRDVIPLISFRFEYT